MKFKRKTKKKAKIHPRDMIYISAAVVVIAVAVILVGSREIPKPEIIAHGETVAYHYHVTTEYYLDNQRQVVPADIGVGIDANHPLAQYGVAGIAPVHTHASDGLIHMESKDGERPFTFGEFLELWGVDLEDKQVTLFANGQRVADSQNYVLNDMDNLRLEVTTR